jgi:asparagine synthase (glutamine-hydrolysing)
VREANPFARHLELYAARTNGTALDRALYVDAHTCLPDNTLATAGCAALAAGIDVRFPFLDREVVEFAATVPGRLKQRGRAGMYVLRRLLGQRLPPILLPPARRPETPHRWLRAALASMVPGVLLAPRFDTRGIVSRPVLRQLWGEHRDGRSDHSHRLWSLLMLEFWFREFIDGDAADLPLEYAMVKAA